MINKLLKTFFKKETKKNTTITVNRLGGMYVANAPVINAEQTKTELSEYFAGFLGLKEIARIRETELKSVVADNA